VLPPGTVTPSTVTNVCDVVWGWSSPATVVPSSGEEVQTESWPHPECPLLEKVDEGKVVPYGFCKTKAGKRRRRYHCWNLDPNSFKGIDPCRVSSEHGLFATSTIEGGKVFTVGIRSVGSCLERSSSGRSIRRR